MSEFGVQMLYRRVVGQKRNDNDSRIRWQKVAFDDHHGNAVVLRDIEAAQLFHEDLPGAAIMSASGCPLRSCQSD